MCHYQVLYCNEKTGYAIRCTECEKIQVAFSNLVMTFNPQILMISGVG
jgi:ribosomal protein S27E